MTLVLRGHDGRSAAKPNEDRGGEPKAIGRALRGCWQIANAIGEKLREGEVTSESSLTGRISGRAPGELSRALICCFHAAKKEKSCLSGSENEQIPHRFGDTVRPVARA